MVMSVGGAPELTGPRHLALARAVAVEVDLATQRAARGRAGRAPRRAGLRDGGQALLPALDVDGALDNTATASIPEHGNRSTTRRLSAKIMSPRRLFCGRHRADAPSFEGAATPSGAAMHARPSRWASSRCEGADEDVPR